MERPGRPTISDVARLAGVHASTVSRALDPSARHRISRAVAERVAAAAEQLGYRPSALAAGLRSGRSHTVGVLVPDLTNPVFPPIVQAIEAALARAGYVTLLASTEADAAKEALLIRRMAAQGADGIILASAATGSPAPGAAARLGLPLVLVNRRLPGAELPAVVSEDAAGIGLAVRHLLALGHRRIAHLGGPSGVATAADRLRGVRAALRAEGLAPVAVERAAAYTRQAGAEATRALLRVRRGGFTAIVAANDLLALGAYDALREAGLRIPADISVTGFNDMPMADLVDPPLTTVRIQHAAMGEAAAEAMLARLRGEAGPGTVRLPAALVVRASAAPPQAG
ncbi:MAG: LacI family transcriptional regulator [Acetobacteraceae bacterium]|nr:LacI family transcriptional regulator [Acetobacteraceae bacterium]MDW8397458.1 LacI family DNA-binding transcriptional regulator [Acetobacteraceae bacterium]